MSKCIVSVAFGEKYEKMGDLMIESFLKYNNGWDAVRIYGNAIRVPVACMPNGNITPFNACEIGRWVAMRELLDKYDEVLYCDNDIRWYGKYNPLNAQVVLSPHYITSNAKYKARHGQFWDGVYNEGIVYVKGDDGKKACDFVISEISGNLGHFIWNEDRIDLPRKNCFWIQEIESYIPEIGLDCKIDSNPGMNVAYWNLAYGDRSVLKDNGEYFVECNGKRYSLVSFHFSHSCIERLPMFGDAVACLLKEYDVSCKKTGINKSLMPMRLHPDAKKGLIDLIENNFQGRKNLVGIEIGSYQGESAELMLSTGKFNKIYCIDAWTNDYDDDDEASFSTDIAEKAFDNRFKNDSRIVKIKGFSRDVVDKIADDSVDFLYVDGCHTKEAVLNDLRAYCSKVKSDGVIGGHDYDYVKWIGVVEAVDEFFGHKPENVFCDCSWSNRKKQ